VNELDALIFMYVPRCVVRAHVRRNLVTPLDKSGTEFVYMSLDTAECPGEALDADDRDAHL
jgi:hypothetical protein